MTEKDLKYLAKECGAQIIQAKNVVEMLEQDMTVPFISRYRKERTGDLDEIKVQQLKDTYEFLKELNNRKETIVNTISKQEKLTPQLKSRIEKTYSKTELEDIYLPYKPKRRTKATIAKEKGLEPLAYAILDESVQGSPDKLAEPYISEEKKVLTIEEALEGAGHIIAEKFSEHAGLRKRLREEMAGKGILSVSVTKEFKEERTKYEQYYDYKEPLKTLPSHRILAIRRGENEKVLKSQVLVDKELLHKKFQNILIKENYPRVSFLHDVFMDALSRLILPSLEQDIRTQMKKQADEEAIGVFAGNVEKLLLSPPAGNRRVMGVDPGYRTGCKLVVLDETGKLLDTATIYPTKPRQDVMASKNCVNGLMEKYDVEAVAIGNGTASRETYQFFKKHIPESIIISVISEAGASVYSASETGREEFPNHDVTVRGSVSIGRRFQDPLAELVKIEPKSIGVGQYQHDVNQTLLKTKLDHVVTSVVNRVGVELNTASYHLLKYVSGIGSTLAKNIIMYRDQKGMFKKREELKTVKMFGEKVYQQSVGFLRIKNGENLLDSTGIHPESYSIVNSMCDEVDADPDQFIGTKELIAQIKPEDFVTDEFGLPTVRDILKELENPGRDPRKNFEIFEFEKGIEKLEDLQEGMVLGGVVTNVTRFGAFVDVGVHQDGLVHVSELSHDFITDPEKVIAVEDKVKVKVLGIDLRLKRIQLSMKALQDPPAMRKKKQKYEKKGNTDPLKGLKTKWGSK